MLELKRHFAFINGVYSQSFQNSRYSGYVGGNGGEENTRWNICLFKSQIKKWKIRFCEGAS